MVPATAELPCPAGALPVLLDGRVVGHVDNALIGALEQALRVVKAGALEVQVGGRGVGGGWLAVLTFACACFPLLSSTLTP